MYVLAEEEDKKKRKKRGTFDEKMLCNMYSWRRILFALTNIRCQPLMLQRNYFIEEDADKCYILFNSNSEK